MSFTERNITCSVDDEFNLKYEKPGFRCVPHKTYKIAVRIEIDDLILPWDDESKMCKI